MSRGNRTARVYEKLKSRYDTHQELHRAFVTFKILVHAIVLELNFLNCELFQRTY